MAELRSAREILAEQPDKGYADGPLRFTEAQALRAIEQARGEALDAAIELCTELSDCRPCFIADRIRSLIPETQDGNPA
jgi:hypothetical protein